MFFWSGSAWMHHGMRPREKDPFPDISHFYKEFFIRKLGVTKESCEWQLKVLELT